jgi:hypothetical protein
MQDTVGSLFHFQECIMRLLSVLAAALLAPAALSAQLTLGARAGIAMSSITGTFTTPDSEEQESTTIDFGNRTALTAGVFLTIPLSQYFSLQPELLYVSRGAKAEDNFNIFGFAASYEVTITVNYLEIPVLARLHIPTGSALTPVVFAGPSMGLKIGEATAKVKVSALGQSQEGTQEGFDDEVKSSDVGAVFGAGVDFALGGGRLVLDARYRLGLTKMAEAPDEGDTEGETDDLKNNTFSISVGYGFTL